MKRHCIALMGLLVMMAAHASAGPREDILAGYAAAAKAVDAGFAGFDAARGKAIYNQTNSASSESPSCTSCHTSSPRNAGRTRAGKVIEPMAVSATPARFTDPEKVEKWFGRNCNTVLGRECTPTEKGDFITYLSGL